MKENPTNVRSLQMRIRNAANDAGEEEARRQATMALVVVGQMLPEGAIKGGSAMAVRYGLNTRFTRDLDVARSGSLEEFQAAFEEALQVGWQGFTGRLVERTPPKPAGVPTGYVMRPFEVKLSYEGKAWCTVDFELGHNEIEDAEEPEKKISSGLVDLFVEIGFSAPIPVPVMRIDHQIAQKIHAVSAPGSDRVRDLVDLQLLMDKEEINYRVVAETCRRLFDYRKAHSWPPVVQSGPNWGPLYLIASEGLPVSQDLEEAIGWLDEIIQEIDKN